VTESEGEQPRERDRECEESSRERDRRGRKAREQTDLTRAIIIQIRALKG
jgi:hypothetical protein